VEFGKTKKDQKVIIVKATTGMQKEYIIPHGKHPNVYKGDKVIAGQQLTDGPVVLQDILRVCGDKVLQEYLVNEVQEVYRLQGVHINDKHIELIIRQMLKKIRVEDPGDTEFLPLQQVDKTRFQAENARIIKKGGKPAQATPLLLGITKASLTTDSFISAASFQETTRMLTEAATAGKRDDLFGLKENVIVGHLIPAGTGFRAHREIEVEILAKQEKEEKTKE
jgi:DNA-directed RNA polymerase subunit beta'